MSFSHSISFNKRFVLTLLLLTFVTTAHAVEIRFQSKATLKTSMVRLGEIAQLSNGNEQELAKLSQVVLMPGPTPGNQSRIDFQMVRSRLQALGVNLSQVQFSGSSVVLVTREGGNIKKINRYQMNRPKPTLSMKKKANELISTALEQYLRGQGVSLATQKVETQIEEADIALVISGKTSGYKIEGGSAPWEKGQYFVAKFQDHRQEVQQVRFAARVVSKSKLWVTRFALPRGHIIKPNDLVLQQDNIGNAPVVRYEDIIGTETTRAIRQDKQVTLKDVRAVPLVRSNDIVTVTSRVGGISVRQQMKARGNAARGQMVTLVSLDGRQMLQAKVTAFHEAEIVGSQTKIQNFGETTGSRIEFRSVPVSKKQTASNNLIQPAQFNRSPSYRKRMGQNIVPANYQQSRPNMAPTPQHQRPTQTNMGQFLPGKYQPQTLPRYQQTRDQQSRGR